jgi:hypothetical protein
MARHVVLYFDDQNDALRFALAAGSVMAGEGPSEATGKLIQETQRARRIKLDEAMNSGHESVQPERRPSSR